MIEGYFHRVNKLSPTKFWINNPSREEARLAIDAGAWGCTCNPSYGQKMLDHHSQAEREYAHGLLTEAIRETADDNEAVALFQRKLVKDIAEIFQPMFEKSNGEHGYVSIQGDPVREHDSNVIIAEALENRKIGVNACIKIPVTASGLRAIDTLVAADIPINSTEIFAMAQVRDLCETYTAACKKSGERPKMYLSHIAGIYDDHLQNYVKQHKIDIYPDVLQQAGLSIARMAYTFLQEHSYPITLIGGGARGLHHFTEMVGGDCVVTINWRGTADALLKEDPPVVWRLFNPVPEQVVQELVAKLPDYRRGYLPDGLDLREYEEFGPVELFRSSFVGGWKKVLGMIGELRTAKP